MGAARPPLVRNRPRSISVPKIQSTLSGATVELQNSVRQRLSASDPGAGQGPPRRGASGAQEETEALEEQGTCLQCFTFLNTGVGLRSG